MKITEHQLQASIVQWFRLQYPKLNLIAIPNGQWIAGAGKQKYALINKYLAEGLTQGVSDLFLAHSDGIHHGLWLELKSEGNKPSKSQLEWMEEMQKAGYMAKWAYTFEDAKAFIVDYI